MNRIITCIKELHMSSVFVRLFLYISFLVLVSVGGVSLFSYLKSSDILLQEVQSNNSLVLDQAKSEIDQQMNDVQSDLVRMALSSKLNKLLDLTLEESYPEYEMIIESIAELSSVMSNTDVIEDIWFYQKKANMVLGPGGKYQKELFLSKVCPYIDEINWETVFSHRGFQLIGKKEVSKGVYNKSVLVVAESLPFIDKNPKGMIVVNLKDEIFKKAMNNAGEEKVILNFVIDGDGKLIYTNDGSFPELKDTEEIRNEIIRLRTSGENFSETFYADIGGNPYSIQYRKSEVFDWWYLSVIPMDFLLDKVNQIRNFTILVALISILFAIFLANRIIARLHKPVDEILQFLELTQCRKDIDQDRHKSNEFILINRIIDYVYKENQALQESIDRSKPVIQENYLKRLINGQTRDNDFLQLGSDIDIIFPYEDYQVIVCELEGGSAVHRGRESNAELITRMKQVAAETLGRECAPYFVDKEAQIIVVILNVSKKFQEESGAYEFLDQLQLFLGENLECGYFIGVGQSYEGADNCYLSYIDALSALKYKSVKGRNSVIYIDEIKEIPVEVLNYSIETESRLINLTKSGNWKEIQKQIEQVFADNFSSGNPSQELVENLFHALTATAIRSMYEMRLHADQVFGEGNNLYLGIAEKNGVEEKKSFLLNVYGTIAQYAKTNKQNQQSHILEKIDRYLEENYQKDISLERASEVVNLSSSYLSFVFKEISGENFVDYVNKFRIEKAKKILKESSMNLGYVAEVVGYSSANSFSKIFKKYMGITPGQYRKGS